MNILSKIKLPGRKDKFSVGLDIGTQAIKSVKLKISGNAFELVAFDLEEGQLDPTDVLKKIKHAQNTDLVNISFSGSSTVIRYVNFLRMSKQELRQALKFEAQKHIPFSLEEVYLDADILKDDLPENKMLVLIAALKKEIMQPRIKSLEAAGLRANLVALDSLALINAFNFNYPKNEIPENKSVCLLNIGSTISNVNIIDQSAARLSRDIHLGGANFTKKLMDIFGVDFKVAEELKLKADSANSEKIKTGVESVATNLALEIRTSFDYYESQNNSNVVKIFLSGGGSKIFGLKEMLAGALGIEVEYWDCFKQIKVSDKLDVAKLDQFSSQFNVALGLAIG